MFGPEERLTLNQAMKVITIGAAGLRSIKIWGTVFEGKVARAKAGSR